MMWTHNQGEQGGCGPHDSMTVYGNTEVALSMCIDSPVWLESILLDTNKMLLLHQRQ